MVQECDANKAKLKTKSWVQKNIKTNLLIDLLHFPPLWGG